MKKVICVSGHAMNGKDTSANYMRERLEARGDSVIIIHYADLLKYICKQYFGWNGEKDEDGRQLLQYIGTDVVREKSPDYWMNFVASFLTLFEDEWDYAIIPDARFPNEIGGLKEYGFDVFHVRVNREGFDSPLTYEQQHHQSEIALDYYPYDHLLINTTLGRLKDDVYKLCDFIAGMPQRDGLGGFEQITFDDLDM